MPAIAKKLQHFLGESGTKPKTPRYLPPPGPPPNIDVKSTHVPPPGPPPRFPKLVDFPLISTEQILTLYNQGYARVHIPPDHPLLDAATALFSTSREFFAKGLHKKEAFHRSKLPPDLSANESKGKGRSSEEGWSRVEGEKEMFTFRRANTCPSDDVARGALENAQKLWKECGIFMQGMTHSIEASLGLESGAFDNLVNEECSLPTDEVHETLLRMFRYERAPEPRVVSEKHRDIGFLSLVIGSSPGLEVWDNAIIRRDPITGIVSQGDWVAIEENDSGSTPPCDLTFTFLVGETLTALSNCLYQPGVHRVSVPPTAPSDDDDSSYRYSLVFTLRPHRKATIHTPSLTTPITGEFKWLSKDGNGFIHTVKAVDLFNRIASLHWSVNDQVEEREARKIRLELEREAKAQQTLMQT